MIILKKVRCINAPYLQNLHHIGEAIDAKEESLEMTAHEYGVVVRGLRSKQGNVGLIPWANVRGADVDVKASSVDLNVD